MAVSLGKASDVSPYGGHSSHTSYTKNPDGTVPDYVLGWRRYSAGRSIAASEGYYLRTNDLRVLSLLYGRTL